MTLKVGILGFGGLGQAAAKLLSAKQEMQLVDVTGTGATTFGGSSSGVVVGVGSFI